MSVPESVGPSVNGWNADFLDAQYELYQRQPDAVEPDVRAFFAGFDLAQAGELKLSPGAGRAGINGTPASVAPQNNAASGRSSQSGPARITPGAGQPAGRAGAWQAVVDDLIQSFRDQGHLAANLDPFFRPRPIPEALTLEYHNLTESDLSRQVDGTGLGLGDSATLGEVIERLREVYCGHIGVEITHIADREQRAWLFEQYEQLGGKPLLDRGQRAHLLELLTQSEMFEKFLGKRYPGEKRFSLEGSESLIPCLEQMIERAAALDVEEIVLGMAHRGRLNVLNNILGKTYKQIFTEFEETWEEDFIDGGGDVKYHRGYSGTKRLGSGRMVHLAMASNPSHLEAVDPVVQGRCRAKQRIRNDHARRRVVPVLVHGDAAVAGQGIVAETLNYSQLEGYTTGGTLHVVVNNQIGFTTVPEDARSSRYCTDIGKAIDAPIFHVNGEDPEAVVRVAHLAIEYRQKFGRDVFIDLQCYRRFGHNEQDEMSFTQPILAKLIGAKESVLTAYSKRLLDGGVINEADIQAIRHRLDESLERAQQAARETPYDPTIDPGSARWDGMGRNTWNFDRVETGVPIEMLTEVSQALGRVPEGFNLNRKLKRLISDRRTITEGDEEKVSYAEAESLAWGTLLLEGYPVRVSGQDCRRGTFSHRHAVWRDAETGEPYIPLNNMRPVGDPGTDMPAGSETDAGVPRQARFCIYDSPLSEESVLGFDYGYSLGDPNMLVCWEAQFGDFVNGAQAIIDQFIASAEAKWDRWSGLVMLLPHGYEGQGPEHSSARMERFLKLCGNNNMQIVYPTTGAQCFHMFRRQLKRGFRKPLVVMTPKSMLRTPTSTIDHLVNGVFQEVIDDPFFNRESRSRGAVKRVILCTGKVYYDLDARRRELEREDVAVVRVEQVYPLHADLLREILGRYPANAEVVWVQEEPRNMGAYGFMLDHLQSELGIENIPYIGRPNSATPAVGSKRQHKIEQERLVSTAVGAKPKTSETPAAVGHATAK